MSKSRAFCLTKNNPPESIEEFLCAAKHTGATFARVQLEKGESGTPHFQACIGYSNPRQLKAMIKAFPGCHVEQARNALNTWEYCGKEDTRLEGPVEFGLPPPSRNTKGAVKRFNEMLIEKGALAAV